MEKKVNQHRTCVVCRLPNLETVKKFEHVHLVRCLDCGMVFSQRIPSLERLIAYYGKYPTSNDMPDLLRMRYSELLDEFEPYRKTNNLMDFGSGNGFLLDEARKRGWNVYGVEFDSRYVANGKLKGIHMKQAPVTAGDFDVTFDVITCIEVIEHVTHPASEIELFHSTLREGGLLYMTTPNFNSFSLKTVGSDWSVVTYPEHLNYFTRSTLGYLCSLHQFEQQSIESSGISIERLSVALKTKWSRFFNLSGGATEINIHEDQKLSVFMEKYFLLRFLKKNFNNIFSYTDTGDTLKGYFIKRPAKPYPKISIVTPSFNQGEFIEDTLKSVLKQNYPNLEYIVIDGASTDDSVAIIRRYEHLIHYWISEPDNGQSQAINKGLSRASGDIVSWLCSDDILLPGALSQVAKAFADHPDAGLIHAKTILFGNGKREVIKGAESDDLALRYLAYIPFPQPSSFFLRKILDEQGLLEEQLHYGMDFDLLIKIALHYPIYQVDAVLSKYRLHPKSKSMSQLAGFAKDWVQVFSKCARTIELPAQRLAQLRSLGLYNDGENRYAITSTLTEQEKDRVLIYFLEYQLHIYYELLDLPLCARIASVIREIDTTLYRQRAIHNIYLKSKHLPAWLIRSIRRIKRIF